MDVAGLHIIRQEIFSEEGDKSTSSSKDMERNTPARELFP